MGIVIKQGIQTTAASYIGVILGFVSFLFLFPLVLSSAQIGLIRVLEEATSMLATFAMAGTPNLCIRFFPYFRDKTNGHNGFLWLLLALPTGGVIIASFLLWLFQSALQSAYSSSPLLLQYWQYILPLTALTMYFLALETYCKSNFFAAVPTLFKEAAKRIIVIIATLLLWYGAIQFDGFMRWFLGAHLFILFCIIAYTRYIGLWQLGASPLRVITKKLRNEMLDFSLFITLGNVGGLLVAKLDTLMLGAIVGLDDTGVYGMAAKLILLIDMPRAAVQQVVFPLLATAFKDNDTAKIAELYKKSALNLLIVGALLLLLLWCNADAIFAFIPNGQLYKSGKIVILLLGIAKVLDMSVGINYEIIAFSRFYRTSALLNLLLTSLAVGINYVCIIKPDQPNALHTKAAILMEEKKYPEALVLLDKIISKNPAQATPYIERGDVQFKLKKFKDAATDYTQALFIRPDFAELYIKRGQARLKYREDDGACEDFTRAASLNDPEAETLMREHCHD